ncbi:unnamed protein product [Oikopleura dioica]|uniref:Peptidase S1 domain-containing protein n=1 Tax=Oikopleura dioica TaxID=34765 RepID=E4XVV4_OIKDI|nr:unnamed protein product [Oikopleura dioica]
MDHIPTGTKCQGNKYSPGYVSPGRIVGGTEAVANSWPWMASLFRNNNNLCGGSLISDEYVLTAAHCCPGFQTTLNNHGVSWRTVVHLGHHAQDDSPASPNRVVANILEVTIHPDYDASAQENDLCLIKIEKVTLNEDVDVVCLPDQGAHVAADDNNQNSGNHCLAAGWGFEDFDNGVKMNLLKSVQVKIYSDLWCTSQAAIQTSAFFAKDVEFCAGWLGTGGRDTCTFDSGGPLVCIENDEPVQYGITSWGSGCGEADNPGIYAEVAEFIRKGHFNYPS